MSQTAYYGRTPLPASVKVPAVFSIVLWMAVIFSPFVAFAVNGKVDDSNWMPAYVTAGTSLLLLVVLHGKAAANFFNLPAKHRDEYLHGKLFEALRKSASRAARDIELSRKNAIVQIAEDGVRVSLNAIMQSDFKRAIKLIKDRRRKDPPLEALAWRDIKKWEVFTDSEGPDYYRLTLADGGFITFCRPAKPHDEYELLDAVRSLGQTAVRLHCDVPR